MRFLICVAFALLGAAVAQPVPTTTHAPAVAVTTAATVKPTAPAKSPNFQTDFDKVLFAFVEEHINRAEEKLMQAQNDALAYQTTRDATLRDKILLEIDRELPILQETLLETQTQAKRTDLSHFEIYLVEKLHNDVALLITHFNHLKNNLGKL